MFAASVPGIQNRYFVLFMKTAYDLKEEMRNLSKEEILD